ncbi:hypothetical protein [Paenibacillus sp. NPDC055715]
MGRPELKRKKGRKKDVFISSWFSKKRPKRKCHSKRRCFCKEIIVRKQIVRVNIPQNVLGITGATGSIGAAGNVGGIAQFGYVYNLGAQVVPIEADVIFDTNGILTPGITHAPGTTQIAVTDAGNYEVNFSVSGVEPGQFAIFINGALAAGTVYGSGAGTQQNTGQAILALASSDVLTLRNHSSAAAVTLQTLAGGTQTNVNASVIIKKLS